MSSIKLLVDSLYRLYRDEKVSKAQIEKMCSEKKITADEMKYIFGAKE